MRNNTRNLYLSSFFEKKRGGQDCIPTRGVSGNCADENYQRKCPDRQVVGTMQVGINVDSMRAQGYDRTANISVSSRCSSNNQGVFIRSELCQTKWFLLFQECLSHDVMVRNEMQRRVNLPELCVRFVGRV